MTVIAFLLTGQEVALRTYHPPAVSPVERVYRGDCEGEDFEITFHSSISAGEPAELKIEVRRGDVSTDLTGTAIHDDLSQDGVYFNSGFTCDSGGHIAWYIWAVRLQPEAEPRYLSGRAMIDPTGRVTDYNGLHDDERGQDYLAIVGGF